MPPTLFSTVLFAASALVAQASPPTIVLDAKFEDWDAVKPLLVDPADAADAFVDLGEVRAAVDDNFVHLLVDFGRTVNVQGLDGSADIILNVDGDDATGAETEGVKGADLIIRCTPPNPDRPGTTGRGIGIASTTYTGDKNDPARPLLNPYDIGLAFAPSYASRRIEFRIARGTMTTLNPPTALPSLFTGGACSGKIVFRAIDGTMKDETDVFSFNVPPRNAALATTQASDANQTTDPLFRADFSKIRVMSWNAELGAIISRPEAFVRTFNAIDPDVVLLQELTDKITAEQVSEFLTHLRPDVSDRPWRVLLGKGGGDLRCAVLSKLPIDAVNLLETVAYPNRPDRSIRIAAAMVDAGGKKLLAASIHLKCCGRNGSPEDETRLIEVDQLHAALKAAVAELKPDGLVIAGDFNLVGSRLPLENMMTGLDIDNTAMDVADTYQLDGRSNATWRERGQPFAPGRLDYMLFSDLSLKVDRCFIYDAWDLAPKWRTEHGTHADDTDLASDHLPVVADFAWR